MSKVLKMSVLAILAGTSLVANAEVQREGFCMGVDFTTAFEKYNVQYAKPTNHKKTTLSGALMAGYNWECSNVWFVGLNVSVGTALTGNNKKFTFVSTDEEGKENKSCLKIKRKLDCNIMPTVSYAVCDACDLFLGAGVNISSYKLSTLYGTEKEWDNSSKTKLAPIATLGVRYFCTENVALSLGYEYKFKTKIVTGLKNQAHRIKLTAAYHI